MRFLNSLSFFAEENYNILVGEEFFMEKINKKVVKRKPMKHRKLFRIVSILLLFLSLIFLIKLTCIGILGFKLLILVYSIFILTEGFILLVLNKRFKVVVKLPFLVIALLMIGAFTYGTYSLDATTRFANKIAGSVRYEEKYNIYVLSDSEFDSIEDLDKTKLGIYDSKSDTLEEAVKILKKKATFKEENVYDDLESMFKECIDGIINVIYMSSTMEEIAYEEFPELFYNLKKIGDIGVFKKSSIEKSDVDVVKEPFLIYISGIDTYGSIANVSRSDVNILVAVNPKTNKILLVNTPRDYYVKLHSKKAFDKLTHAGNYGVEESITTLEDLYATDIDFYVKLNFSSLIKIVNTLGGITVDSKYNFAYDGHSFHKGKNNLNGEAALAFSRCRKELPGGDVSRGENQEAVIKGLIEKVTSPSIITKYKSLLDTLGESVVTNMSEEEMFSLAKMQLNDNPSWEVESKNVKGYDAYKITYSAGKTKLYVMDPDEESVTEVKLKLNEILEED